MKRSSVFASALLATLLLIVPTQSQAFFGCFSGGFGFGFGSSWWGGPGYWHGPGYWGRPWGWRHYRPYRWGYRYWGPEFGAYPFSPLPPPIVEPPAASPEK